MSTPVESLRTRDSQGSCIEAMSDKILRILQNLIFKHLYQGYCAPTIFLKVFFAVLKSLKIAPSLLMLLFIWAHLGLIPVLTLWELHKASHTET